MSGDRRRENKDGFPQNFDISKKVQFSDLGRRTIGVVSIGGSDNMQNPFELA